MRSRDLFASVLTVVFLFFGAHAADAQFARGSIYGTVTDADGLAVPGVTVTLTSVALLQPETDVTSATGTYRFPTLPPGEYEVTAELLGFRTFVRRGIAVVGGSTVRIDGVLAIAELEETITVTGEAPPVDVRTNVVQAVYDSATLQDLPSTRNIWSVMESMPSVVLESVDVGGSFTGRGNQVFAYGSQGAENTYNLNGVDITDPSGGAGGNSYIPQNQDSFSEIRVETGVKSPEVRGAGINVNMTTKSGGNTLSGGGSFFGQGERFNSDNVSDELRQRGVQSSNEVLKNIDYSGQLGGPILRNRIWFFAAGLHTYRDRAVLNFFLPDGTLGNDVVNNRSYTGKITSLLPGDNRFEFYYNRSKRLAPYLGAGPNTNFDAVTHEEIDNDVIQATLTTPLGRSGLLDVRGGYFLADFMMLDGPFLGPNPVRWQELTTGRNSGAPGSNRHHWRTRYRFDAAMSWYVDNFLGSHEFRGGIQWEDGGQQVNTNVHGDHWLFFDNGVPNRVRVWNSPSHYHDRYRDVAFHINDVWSPLPRVTITAGLRVSSAESYWPEQTNREVRTTKFNQPPRAGTYFPEEIRLAENRSILKWTNPAPRLGLTIDPAGDARSAIRFSYGRYYAALNSNYADVINPNLARFTTLGWNDLNGDRLPQTDELDVVSLLDFSNPSGSGLFGDQIDSSAKQPLEDQIAVGYDRQVGQHVSAGVSYHYHRGSRGLGYENQLVPFSGGYTPVTIDNPLGSGSFELLNLLPELRGVSQRILTTQEDATRTYHGVEFNVRRRFANRWRAQGSLTIGRGEGIAVDHFRSFWQDPNILINRYGADPQDSRVLARLGGSYLLPFDLMVGVNYRHNGGREFTPTLRVRGLNQGDVTINTERPGTTRLDSQNLLDLRLEKRFSLRPTGEIGLMVDAFNLLNVSSVLSQNALSGTLALSTGAFAPSPTFRQVNSIMPPRALRFGVRYTF